MAKSKQGSAIISVIVLLVIIASCSGKEPSLKDEMRSKEFAECMSNDNVGFVIAMNYPKLDQRQMKLGVCDSMARKKADETFK